MKHAWPQPAYHFKYRSQPKSGNEINGLGETEKAPAGTDIPQFRFPRGGVVGAGTVFPDDNAIQIIYQGLVLKVVVTQS